MHQLPDICFFNREQAPRQEGAVRHGWQDGLLELCTAHGWSAEGFFGGNAVRKGYG